MRQSLGTAVFSGMLGVTIFGLLFTPALYTLIRKIKKSPTKNTRAKPAATDSVMRREGPSEVEVTSTPN